MKKLLLLSIAILTAGFCYAQKVNVANVPSQVKSAFHERFPKATEIQWSKVNKDDYSAAFNSEAKAKTATFTSAGLWRTTESVIKSTELTKAIRATIAKQYAGYKVVKSVKTEAPGQPFFFIEELNKAKVTAVVTFSSDGKIVKKESK